MNLIQTDESKRVVERPETPLFDNKALLEISETAVENNLTFLKKNGYVERVGSKKTGYWKVLE